jgi:hypothetical protein
VQGNCELNYPETRAEVTSMNGNHVDDEITKFVAEIDQLVGGQFLDICR